MMPTRLTRGVCTGGSRNDHYLTVVRHMHVKPLLRHFRQPAAPGERADLALELGPLADELRPLAVKHANLAGLGDAVAAPPDHARRDEHEGHQGERDPGPAAPSPWCPRYLALRHARSRAL